MSTSAVEATGYTVALAAVADQDESQQRTTRLAQAAIRRLWRRMRGRRWSTGWEAIAPQVVEVITEAQLTAVTQSARYATAALAETGLPTADPNPLNPDGFAGITGAGYPVEERAYSAVLEAVDSYYESLDRGIDEPAAARTALVDGEQHLGALVDEILADAMRAAEAVAFAARPWVDGFIRSPEPGACSRCIVLAGKFFLFNDGFERHPRCRCVHLPAPPAKAERDALLDATSPQRYFDSLTEAEQNKTFGAAGAEAIRLGADIGQVVNARRGMSKAQVFGRDVLVTSEGTTRRGLAYRSLSRGTDRSKDTFRRVNGRRQRVRSAQAPRLMPESLAEIAGDDRAEFIRLLRLNGFVL